MRCLFEDRPSSDQMQHFSGEKNTGHQIILFRDQANEKHNLTSNHHHVDQKNYRAHIRLRYLTPQILVMRTSANDYACDLGTNLQALIDALNTPALPEAEINLVLSNRKAAYGLTRAAQANPPIPTAYLALQPYLKQNPGKTREDYDAEVAKIVLRTKPELVVLAGWMHILSESFLELLDGRKAVEGEDISPRKPIPVINLHPALPGQFDGAGAIERAFEAFQKGEISRSGAMVHRVVKDVDRGEPLVIREVPFVQGETLEDYEERLHGVEHKIIVEATKRVLDETTL